MLQGVLDVTPPSLNEPAAGELWELLKIGRRFRALGRTDGFRLLRWMPMAVADLVAEWFSTDLLMAAIAARGIFGTAQGPWSAGTGAVLLLNAAVDPAPGGSSVMVKGGTGALTAAMADAAREAGAEIRTGATVTRVLARDGHVTGVVLDTGEEIQARAVIANADPKRTLLHLVDPVDLDPGFLSKMRNYRMPGTVAKLDFALTALPSFRAVPRPADLRGRLHIGPTVDYLERAFDASKYGEISTEPYLDIAFPSVLDPSLAPPDDTSCPCTCSSLPSSSPARAWSTMRDTLATTVLRTLERYAPGIGQLVEGQRSPHAGGSRDDVRPHRRSYLSRRAVARSALHDAARARLGAIPHADRRTLPLRRRHASRRRDHGCIRSQRGAGNRSRVETPPRDIRLNSPERHAVCLLHCHGRNRGDDCRHDGWQRRVPAPFGFSEASAPEQSGDRAALPANAIRRSDPREQSVLLIGSAHGRIAARPRAGRLHPRSVHRLRVRRR